MPYNKDKRPGRHPKDTMDTVKRYEQEEAASFIPGRNPVIEALKSGRSINTIFINGEGGSLGLICKMAKEKGIVIKQVSDSKLSAMSGGASHQGVIASCACAEVCSLLAAVLS